MMRQMILISSLLSLLSTGCYCSRPVLFPRLGCAGCAVPMTPAPAGPIFPRINHALDGYAPFASPVVSGAAASCEPMGSFSGWSAGSPIAISGGHPIGTPTHFSGSPIIGSSMMGSPVMGSTRFQPTGNCAGCESHYGTVHNGSQPTPQFYPQPVPGIPMNSVPLHQPTVMPPSPMGPKVEMTTDPKKEMKQ